MPSQTTLTAIAVIWSGPGFVCSIIYIGYYYYWVFKTKHEEQHNFKLIFKWAAIMFMVVLPVTLAMYSIDESMQIAVIMMPLFYFPTQLVAFALYRLKWIEKYELCIPLVYLVPGIIPYLYKKHQTAMLQYDSQKAE
jgi:hypothetical protein